MQNMLSHWLIWELVQFFGKSTILPKERKTNGCFFQDCAVWRYVHQWDEISSVRGSRDKVYFNFSTKAGKINTGKQLDCVCRVFLCSTVNVIHSYNAVTCVVIYVDIPSSLLHTYVQDCYDIKPQKLKKNKRPTSSPTHTHMCWYIHSHTQ